MPRYISAPKPTLTDVTVVMRCDDVVMFHTKKSESFGQPGIRPRKSSVAAMAAAAAEASKATAAVPAMCHWKLEDVNEDKQPRV